MPARRVSLDGMAEYQIAIRRLLHERGISYEQLGKMASVAKNSISMMLNGSDVRIGTLRKIATALNVEMGVLFVPMPADRPLRERGHAATQDELMEAFKPALMNALAELLVKRVPM